MTVLASLLRILAMLVTGFPVTTASGAPGVVPVLTVAALGIAAVVTAVVLARVLLAVLVTLLAAGTGSVVSRAVPDLVTRIAWSHPDADGQVRSRAPGVVATA